MLLCIALVLALNSAPATAIPPNRLIATDSATFLLKATKGGLHSEGLPRASGENPTVGLLHIEGRISGRLGFTERKESGTPFDTGRLLITHRGEALGCEPTHRHCATGALAARVPPEITGWLAILNVIRAMPDMSAKPGPGASLWRRGGRTAAAAQLEQTKYDKGWRGDVVIERLQFGLGPEVICHATVQLDSAESELQNPAERAQNQGRSRKALDEAQAARAKMQIDFGESGALMYTHRSVWRGEKVAYEVSFQLTHTALTVGRGDTSYDVSLACRSPNPLFVKELPRWTFQANHNASYTSTVRAQWSAP